MNHNQEYFKRIEQDWRNQYFKNHQAAVPASGDYFGMTVANALVLRWANPESWNYGCHFIIHRRWLTVVGDIGEAVYEWSSDLTLNFLAGIDFGYFYGKCVSSPAGREFKNWDEMVAVLNVSARLAELKELPAEDQSCDHQAEVDALELLGHESAEEYQRVASELYGETGDAELAGSIAEFGFVPDGRSIGHFVGLQMAIAQLRASAV